MPWLEHDNVRLYHEFDDRHASAKPVLVLSNSLGTHLGMWAPQLEALRRHFRLLRYDTRGHGQSSVPDAPFGVAQLGGDVLALLDHYDIELALFCGLSMGGLTGLWLAAHHGERFLRMVVSNTAALIGTPQSWNARIAQVEQGGMAGITGTVLERWLTDGYRAAVPERVDLVKAMLLATPPAGYNGNCAAIRDADLRAQLQDIRVPLLAIGGTHDISTPAAQTRAIAQGVPGAQYVELSAGHLANWEQAEAYTDALVGFLTTGVAREAAHG
ncbi:MULTISPECIES: 3-oxoadipate enol-lactonase [Ralstonia solanacearum species complex]|uniref:B-ketoadipate enol-lactone hydrolase protein n=2 Tax=Ralstonia solanacearum TaxID=305 RepID=A0ABF7REF5_RALSL|nr:3-oxoadipate enol-lactonase [Ralstonia solanacearum]ALF87574.1 3-oxoadipate enol-lactonase 2 [Ralstonia solanacearum]ATI27085.1 3-oxoadipate enol-lactonase [Ralstonia solanacearum]EAP74001.1 3-oxoadipate enol-lactonase [Ralstonia solanacearum UW551]KEI32453.1 3-oxoadipate enol-lactonase [Ralstonia solanacearum]KFX80305.1 3-oxoadipate enol-lactonase [Ralstonia solanacearum]